MKADNNKLNDLLFSIIIVNWNGKELLEKCLFSVREAIKYDGKEHETIVVDNGSVDGSVEFVKRMFPEVKILSLGKNYGFGEGNNRGVEAANKDIVILLNNDMIVEKDFLPHLKKHFNREDIFAVSAQIFFTDNKKRREETGRTTGRFRRGFFEVGHALVRAGDSQSTPALYAGGGSSAYDKKKFLELKGFDKLFKPFYLEDLDISYRAWKKGWKIIFEPESKIYHVHRGTINKYYTKGFINDVIAKNKILFVWKNINDGLFLLQHVFFMTANILRSLFKKSQNSVDIRAFLLALRQLPEALRGRFEQNRCVYNDRKIIELTSDL